MISRCVIQNFLQNTGTFPNKTKPHHITQAVEWPPNFTNI